MVAIAPDDVWAGGPASRLFHFDGVAWTDTKFRDPYVHVQGLWASGPDDVWGFGTNIDPFPYFAGGPVLMHRAP